MMFDDICTDAKGEPWCSCQPQKERTSPRAEHECADCNGLIPLVDLDQRYGNVYCRCELQELPQNPERRCSRCGEFIAISRIDEGDDWAAWVESMMTPDGRELHERQRNPELLGDVLARSMGKLQP